MLTDGIGMLAQEMGMLSDGIGMFAQEMGMLAQGIGMPAEAMGMLAQEKFNLFQIKINAIVYINPSKNFSIKLSLTKNVYLCLFGSVIKGMLL